MNPTSVDRHVRHAAIEQVMRVTDDDTLVWAFRDAPVGSPAAQAALGRLLVAAPVHLVPGSPLLAFVAGTALSETWRDRQATTERSLWSTLGFLDSIYPDVAPAGADPYTRLEALLAHADEDLSAN